MDFAFTFLALVAIWPLCLYVDYRRYRRRLRTRREVQHIVGAPQWWGRGR